MSADDLNAQAHAKLAELRREYNAGEAMLQDLEQRRAGLRETMLRISGAIQSLEELLQLPPAHAESESPRVASHQEEREV